MLCIRITAIANSMTAMTAMTAFSIHLRILVCMLNIRTMNSTIRIDFHCYNHHAMDMGMSMAKIVDAAHRYDTVIIDTMWEPFDIRQIEWKGTKVLQILRSVCESNGWPLEKFHWISYNPVQPKDSWPSMEVSVYTQPFTTAADKRFVANKEIKKHFGIYINNSSWPRLWLSSHLFDQHPDKTDQTFVRSPVNAGHMANLDLDALLFNFTAEGHINQINLDRVQHLIQHLPLTNSTINLHSEVDQHFDTRFDLEHTLSPLANDIMHRYNSVFVDVVCETMFTGQCVSFDEKIARCLISKTPFVMMGAKHCLRYLRALGFRTFGDFWDESYDHCSGANRCVEIARLLDTIAEHSQAQLTRMYDQMSTVLEHNHSRYLELCAMPDLSQYMIRTMNGVASV